MRAWRSRRRELLLYGDTRLRAPCRPVEPGEPGLGGLISRMREIMLRHDGVGLA